MRTSLLAGWAMAAVLPAAQGPAVPDAPAVALAAMLDLPDPGARRAAADALARREDVTLGQWLEAAGSVPPRKVEPDSVHGSHRVYRVWLFGAMPVDLHVRLPADSPRAQRLPLMLVGHEARADGASAIATWAPLADRHGFLLVAVSATGPDRDGWVFEADQVQYEALRAVRRLLDVDEDRVVVAGVGRGGHMAWDLALRRPDLFCALIAANGSPRLGNAPANNMRYLESLVPVAVRALSWEPREAMQVANEARAFALLRRFAARDVRQVVAADAAAAFASPAAGWDAFLSRRRTVGASLVRIAEVGMYPLPPHFGRLHWLDIVRIDPKWDENSLNAPVRVDRRLDEQGWRDAVDQAVRDRSPRLQVTRRAPGRFEVVDRHVQFFRLLLTPAMVADDGTVTVSWRGHTLTKTVEPSAQVLLRDFAERFDRTFLPTIEVVFP